ncbi:hypothetical protein [Pseudomonas sp.]|uniref:hypothetical protein n=1 Tax=Pseudomonas sp. TaxID=306 RepID=UPI00260D3737|nr:hypothetical protein [Pseudomonas sp.]
MRLLFAVMGFCMLAGCALQSEKSAVVTFEHMMFKADERIQARNFEAGRKLLSEAAAMEPTRKEPWLRQAELEFEAENYGAAILAAQEVLQRDAVNTRADAILTVSGLRVAVQSLGRLRDEKDVNGPVHQEARKLAAKLRETLGAKALLPKARAVPRKPMVTPVKVTPAASSSNPFSSLPGMN